MSVLLLRKYSLEYLKYYYQYVKKKYVIDLVTWIMFYISVFMVM